MDQTQQLSQLVERSFANGWSTIYELQRLYSWQVIDDKYLGLCLQFDDRITFSLNDLLFGDELSFLKSLVGEYAYDWFAKVLAAMQPEHRVPSLHSHVYAERDA